MKLWARAVVAAAVFVFALSTVAASAVTTAGPPGAPRNLKATAGDAQVTLSWSPPSSGAPIIQYRIIVAPGNFRTATTSTTVLVTGLTNGTTYSFAVQALNAVGYGTAARATATPHVIPPTAPTNLAATSGPGTGQITLSWTPPTSNGSGDSIAHYTITVTPGGTTAQVDGQTTTYVASNLAANVTYTFKVTATNSKAATGPAATVYAPLPIGANIGMQPTAGGPSTSITVTGQSFLQNESITLYWDVTSHVATSVVTDDNGAFTKVIKPYPGDKPKVHKLCANVQPRPCATFSLQGPPTPTPGVTPSPASTSPTPATTGTPQASGVRVGGTGGTGGTGGLDFVTRPPFVFLLIVAILVILGVLAYWFVSRRRSMPPSSAATITHRATRPDYMAPFPPAGSAAPPPRNPAQPSAWDVPVQPGGQPYVPPAQPSTPPDEPYVPPAQPYVPPAPPAPVPPPTPPRTVEWPAPPAPPTAPDAPPDLPQPSD
ncbi:MAG TPA: fibronectin type III domain-containing protein [Candidatus Micrarchaeaceae archaeon]|nr:fibronectin type III domain-containing protein [Candidatus Micrarchaeaceae archaeon]